MIMARSDTRPHLWKSGPDPLRHELREQCQRRRAQAWYRGEQWLITEDEFIELWLEDNRHLNKGRSPHNLCMTRVNFELPWTINNVAIISRAEHFKNCNDHKKAMKIARTRLKEEDRVRP